MATKQAPKLDLDFPLPTPLTSRNLRPRASINQYQSNRPTITGRWNSSSALSSSVDDEIFSMDQPPEQKRQRIGEEGQDLVDRHSRDNDGGGSNTVNHSLVEQLEQGSSAPTPESSHVDRDTNYMVNTPQSSTSNVPTLTTPTKNLDVDPGALIKHDLSQSPEVEIIETSPRKDKGKEKEKISPSPPPSDPSQPHSQAQERQKEKAESLSEYTCPICFFPPSNATLTPCGHVCCGSCLFTAIKTTLKRGENMGMAVGVGENVARCPVCRAIIHGWDGKGGGVIGLKIRQVINL